MFKNGQKDQRTNKGDYHGPNLAKSGVQIKNFAEKALVTAGTIRIFLLWINFACL